MLTIVWRRHGHSFALRGRGWVGEGAITPFLPSPDAYKTRAHHTRSRAAAASCCGGGGQGWDVTYALPQSHTGRVCEPSYLHLVLGGGAQGDIACTHIHIWLTPISCCGGGGKGGVSQMSSLNQGGVSHMSSSYLHLVLRGAQQGEEQDGGLAVLDGVALEEGKIGRQHAHLFVFGLFFVFVLASGLDGRASF